MAGIATDIWEFRATNGTANNGGGFDTASGGTDYSDQNGAELALTDLATSGIGVTTLTSATGGFTAAMVGNYIQIRSGTNATAGFYRVTVRTDTNTVTLDRAPDDGVGGVSGGSGDLGGALDDLSAADATLNTVLVAGSTIWIKNETMTPAGAVSFAADGTALLHIKLHGYDTSRGDLPKGTSRPLIIMGANSFAGDNFWNLANLRFTSTAAQGIRIDSNPRVENCSFNNTSGSAGRPATRIATDGAYIATEAQSLTGSAFFCNGGAAKIVACYAHDSVTGFQANADSSITACVADTNTTGIDTSTNDSIAIVGNTIYGNTTGILQAAGGTDCVVINNILDGNTTGITLNDKQESWYMDYNVWDNTTDVNANGNIAKGPNAVTGDPGMADPANGDFTLGSGSNALDVGLKMSTDIGTTGTYKQNVGVDQDDNAAGGGVVILNDHSSSLLTR